MVKGLIFDIKRYAIHDGPGIRTTVFFKGCPLRCPWCHNPEGQEFAPEIMVKSERCAKDCQECISHCPQGAISKDGAVILVDPSKCDFCAKCKEVCVYEAIDIMSRRTKKPGIEVFEEAVKNATPLIEVRPRRVGGATYQIPLEVRPERRQSLAIRWLVNTARARAGKSMAEKLAAELMDAANQRGAAIKKREDTHRMAEANKAFAHYRW